MEIKADEIICKINNFIRTRSLKHEETIDTKIEVFQNSNAKSETKGLKKNFIGMILYEKNELDENDIEYDSEELIENLVGKIFMSLKQ